MSNINPSHQAPDVIIMNVKFALCLDDKWRGIYGRRFKCEVIYGN